MVGAAVVDDDDLVVGVSSRAVSSAVITRLAMVPAVVVGREEHAETGSRGVIDRGRFQRRHVKSAVPTSGQGASRSGAPVVGRLEAPGDAVPAVIGLHAAAAPRAQRGPRAAVGEQAADGGGQRRRRRAPATSRPLSPSSTTAPMPPARGGDQRRARRQRFHDDVGQAVDVAGVVADRGHDRDVGGGQVQRHDSSWASRPRKRTWSATPACRARARSSASQIAVAGDHHLSDGSARDQRRHRVDQVLEPLLPHEAGRPRRPAARRRRRRAGAATARPRLRAGAKALARRRRRGPPRCARRRRRARARDRGDRRCRR